MFLPGRRYRRFHPDVYFLSQLAFLLCVQVIDVLAACHQARARNP